MWFLEIVESVLFALPWISVAIFGVIAVLYAFAITSWVAMWVWVDLLDREIEGINLEPAGSWDPDELEEASHGRPT